MGAICRFSRSESVDQAVETYGLQKITLLREISLKTGIQVGAGPCPSVHRLCEVPVLWGLPTCCGWEVLAM